MENKLYVLVNKITGDALFEFDKNNNSRIIVGPYAVLEEMLINNENMPENLIIVSEEEYFLSKKKNIKNQKNMDVKDKLCDEILEMIHNGLPKNLKNAIEFDSEKNDRNVNGFPSIIRCIGNDDIKKNLWERFDAYEQYLKNKIAFNNDSQLLNDINSNIRHIKSAWQWYQNGNINKATEQIE